MKTLRGHIGATVRLYGYPGTFRIVATSTSNLYDWYAVSAADERCGFPINDSSVVEIDGLPVALRSLPIAPPASDWPHGVTLVEPRNDERRWPLCRNIEADQRFVVVESADERSWM